MRQIGLELVGVCRRDVLFVVTVLQVRVGCSFGLGVFFLGSAARNSDAAAGAEVGWGLHAGCFLG